MSLDLNKTSNIGGVMLDNALNYRRTLPEEGLMTQAVQLRTGLAVQGVGITNELEASWRTLGVTQYAGELNLSRGLLGGHARVALDYRPNAQDGFWRTMDISYQRTLSENLNMSGRYQQNLNDTQNQRYSGQLDYQLRAVTLGLSGYGDGRGDYGGQLSLRTELQPGAEGYEVVNMRESRTGGAATVKLFVFVDNNGNSQFDTGELPIEGLKIANLGRNSTQTSNESGEMVFRDIPSNMPVRLEVVVEELPDIYLKVPARPLVVFGQAGASGEYSIPLQRLGEINGTLMRETRDGRKRPVAALQLVALDADGKVVGRTRTQSDGFFIMDNLPLGLYTLTPEAADNKAKGLSILEKNEFTLNAERYLIEGIELFVSNSF